MKSFCFAVLCAFTAVLPSTLLALEWNSGVTGGRRDGTWQNGGPANWNDSAGAPTSSNDSWSFLFGTFTTAGFNAPEDGTITVSGTVRTSGIEAGNGGTYTLTGGTINRLFADLPIDVGTGGSGALTIGATLSTGTAIKQGPGTLNLTGATTGNLRIEGGLVTLSGDNIPDGSNLEVQSGTRVAVNGNDTINDLDLAGTVSGPGTLSANTYTLRDGALIGGNLGQGDFIKADAGTVTLNGTAASDVINIPDGTLVLSGNNLDDLAQVTTSGNAVLEINGNDTVGTYLQNDNASLTGTGTLTTTNGATLNGGEIAGSLNGATTVQGSVLVSGGLSGGVLALESGALTATGTIRSRDIDISPGATLLQQGEFMSRSTLTNNGTLTVDSNATSRNGLRIYQQNPGALMNGSGILSVGESALNGGEVAGRLVGDTTIDGDVLVSGSIEQESGRNGLSITNGTLTLTGAAVYRRINIDGGGTLLNQGDLDERTRLENSGSLANEIDETIDWYIQRPGGALTGTGTLTTTNLATLTGGEVASTLLGDTSVTGPVTVSGTIGAGTLTVNSGTLTLTGTSTNDPVTIAPSATLIDQGNLADTAMLTNDGTLTVEVPELIGSYVQTDGGLLNGAGTLTTTGGATLRGGEIAGTLFGNTTVSTDRSSLDITGTVGGGTLVLTDGRLNLTGTATSPRIEVNGGRLTLGGDNIADSSALVLGPGSRLDVDGSETVDTVSIAGVVWGSNTLTANTYTLLDGAIINTSLGEGFYNKADAGTVRINRSIGADSIVVPQGTLILSGNNLEDTADVALTTGGTLHLLGNETVRSFNSVGGTLSGEAILLTTDGASLNNGSTVAAALAGNTTSNGDVLVSGRTILGHLAIESGTLTATGDLANETITINPGATLHQQGFFLPEAALTNHGTFTNDIDSEIATYTQTPGSVLNGSGTLTADSGATLNGGEIAGTLVADTVIRADTLISGIARGEELTVGEEPADFYRATLTNFASGTLDFDTITILEHSALLNCGTLSDTAVVTNNGMLTTKVPTTIGSYLQHEGGILNAVHTNPLTTTVGATLYGGEIQGRLNGTTRVEGDVLATGEILGDSLILQNGILTSTGTLSSTNIEISPASTLVQHGNFRKGTLTNGGTLTVESNTTANTGVKNYIQNSGGLLDGDGLLATSEFSLNGGEIAGNLQAVHGNSTGDVLISGVFSNRFIHIDSGTLTLTGEMAVRDRITIELGGTLVQQGDLAEYRGRDGAIISNSGTLTVEKDSMVSRYWQDPTGLLNGSSVLTASGSISIRGGEVAGHLRGETNAFGNALISGSIGGGRLELTGSTLTVTGLIANSPITIHSDATILDQSPLAFSGDNALTNHGLLVLDGHETVHRYHSSPTGNLQLKVTGSTALDHLTADTVTLDPGSSLILEKTELLLGQMADIIDSAVTGTFTMIDALAGAGKDLRYSFNPNDGTIQALPGAPVPAPTPSNTLYNLSPDQTQVIGTAFDDTHLGPDPNFRRRYFRDTGNPDPALRWQEITLAQARPGDTAIYDLDPGLGRAPVAPGTQAALLGNAIATFQSSFDPASDPTRPMVSANGFATANALSPESHQGMADFTRHALRTQMRTAMRTPNGANAGKGHVFATFHTGSAGASAPTDGASYNIDLGGGVAGVRYHLSPDLRIGAMLGTVDGDITGPHIHTDAHGFSIGVFGEYLLDDASQTTAFASLGLGTYSYDATRQSFGGPVYANNIDSSAIELALGIETIAWQSERFRLLPRAAFRYLDGEVDGFTETGPGVQMHIASLDTQSLLFELGVDAEYDLNERTTLNAHLGVLTDLLGSGDSVSGTYVGGGLPVSVHAPGIDSEALILGLGASLDLNATTSLDINWRSEFRDDSQHTHLLTLGARATF